MAAATRPILASCHQGAAMTVPACLRQNIKLRQAAMTALRLDDKEMARCVMGKRPANGFAVLLGDQENAMTFSAAMLDIAPVIGGKIGIAPAVRLEDGFVILQAGNEGQNRRFVGRQARFAYAANDRAP
jgi:hypothetical protein